jgi:hypothetical protein
MAFNFACTLSLLLCAAAAAAWVRSYHVQDNAGVRWTSWPDPLHYAGRETILRSFKGTWTLAFAANDFDFTSGSYISNQMSGTPAAAESWRREQPPGWEPVWRPFRGDSFVRFDGLVEPTNRLGFAHERSVRATAARRDDYRVIRLPAWLPVLALSVLPSTWLWRRRCSRRRSGHCPSCGYDLRATPDRCPECGYAAGTTTA